MLPYSPLHHLLLEDFGGPLVATSGNLSGEPVLTEPEEARARLAESPTAFCTMTGRSRGRPTIRWFASSRGPRGRCDSGAARAPLELRLPARMRLPTLAVGAYLEEHRRAGLGRSRGALAAYWRPREPARHARCSRRSSTICSSSMACAPQRIAHDAHPGFPNTRWARESGLPTHAGMAPLCACGRAWPGEYPGEAPLLCFTWDGVGLGAGRTLWGGEALLGRPGAWQRVASFRPFRLPGGERAAREPWRTALALCWESGLIVAGRASHRAILCCAPRWERGVNAPCDHRRRPPVRRRGGAARRVRAPSYEGEAPMRLEALAERPPSRRCRLRCRWSAMRVAFGAAIGPRSCRCCSTRGKAAAARAALFHASLAHALCEQALVVRRQSGVVARRTLRRRVSRIAC